MLEKHRGTSTAELAKGVCEIVDGVLYLLRNRVRAAAGVPDLDLAFAIRAEDPGFEANIDQRDFDRVPALGAPDVKVYAIQVAHFFQLRTNDCGHSVVENSL
ncbi:MAG: hypothetical protein ACLQIB_20820 [Isosphaeraceae bacterium]